jgi:hypothetical protein
MTTTQPQRAAPPGIQATHTICAHCGNRVFRSGGHNINCPVQVQADALKRQHVHGYASTPSAIVYEDAFGHWMASGGMTESEFFGGDLGDKG